MKKMRIIDLLCLISNGEEVPKKIKYCGCIYRLNRIKIEDGYYIDYYCDYCCEMLFADVLNVHRSLNTEIEILDDEEDKDIPLIPDDELCIFKGDSKELNYNFRVLQEKINQVIEELNRRNNEKEDSNDKE